VEPVTTVTTSAGEGVTLQNDYRGATLSSCHNRHNLFHQKKTKEGCKGGAQTAVAAPASLRVAKQVVTVVTPPKTVAALSVCLSQPPETEVVTPREVVTPPKPVWADAALAIHQEEPTVTPATVAIRLETEHGFPGVPGSTGKGAVAAAKGGVKLCAQHRYAAVTVPIRSVAAALPSPK
jgi:hypothetical protein